MTATIELAEPPVSNLDVSPEIPEPDPLAGPDYPPYAEIPIERLELNPYNVRPLDEYGITDDYIQTIRDLNGPENDLVVFPSPTNPGMFWPHDGNRRLRGSQMAGLTTLWCRIKPELAHDRRAMLLGQLTTSHQHEPLSEGATADALFQLDGMGVSRDQLRRASGWKGDQVDAAIKAGNVSEETRAAFSAIRQRPPTMQEAAALAEVEDDPDAKNEAFGLIRTGHTAYSAVSLVKRRRKEAAIMAQLTAELQAAGVPITEDMPDGAVRVWRLVDSDGAEMSDEAHAACPGHGAYFPSRTSPAFYCTVPAQHGYTVPPQRVEPPRLPTKQIREGNTAWRSSGELRQEWLKQRLNSRTDPGQVVLRAVARLVAIEMPAPLADKLGSIHSIYNSRQPTFYTDLVGNPKAKQVATAPTARLSWMLFARVAATMEHWLTQTSYSDYLWRPDRGREADRKIVADWFALCEELGHTLTPIEKTLRNGSPYTPDQAAGIDTGTTVADDTEAGDDRSLNDEDFAGDTAADGDFGDGDLDEADVDSVDDDQDVTDTPLDEHTLDADVPTSDD
ncbi:ParB/RepB/Spo0J family partition protein [Nonomuraea sp. NPDC049400]|uniref:ParB/RepB/Spo0J family partition protein n=1 Tax=Nonomuraea sp. NPDC049400 TaxID=3364352 RepID=UPI0037B40076